MAKAREANTMNADTATRAHNVISIALGATTYRATSDEALSVANIPAGTVVIERATYALSDNVAVEVTLQLSNGDVWSRATWDSDDAYGILCETLAFIRRHTETQAATAEDADDCSHCNGTGGIYHSRTVGNRPCPYCDGTGGSGAVICGHCDGTGSAADAAAIASHCTHLPPVDTDCPDCGGDGIIPAIGCDEKYIPCTTCTH